MRTYTDFVDNSNKKFAKPRFHRVYRLTMPETDDTYDLSEYQKARAKHIAKREEVITNG